MKKIDNDKLAHFLVCFAVAGIIATLVAIAGALSFPACVAGFLGSSACGMGKEYGDSRAPGNAWSWGDLAADVAGAAVGCLFGLIALLM